VRTQKLAASTGAGDGGTAVAPPPHGAGGQTQAAEGAAGDGAPRVGAFATGPDQAQLLKGGDAPAAAGGADEEAEEPIARQPAAAAVSAREHGVVGGRHWVGDASSAASQQLLKEGGGGGGGGAGAEDDAGGGGGGLGGGDGGGRDGGGGGGGGAGGDRNEGEGGGGGGGGASSSSSTLRDAEIAAQALLADGARDIELTADRVAVVARRARAQRREAEAQRLRGAAAAAAADKDAGRDGPTRAATTTAAAGTAAGGTAAGSTKDTGALSYKLGGGADACPEGGGPPEGAARDGAIAVALLAGRNPAPMVERALRSLLDARATAAHGGGARGGGGEGDESEGEGDKGGEQGGDDPDADGLRGVFHLFVAQDGDDRGVRELAARYAAETSGAVRLLQRPAGTKGTAGAAGATSDPTGAGLVEAVLRAFFQCWDYPYLLLAEDDQLFAPDALSLLQATAWLLDSEGRAPAGGLWCASLWQENGQPRTARDARALRRTDHHPGRAWMVSRRVGLELLREFGARRLAFEGAGAAAPPPPPGRRGWEEGVLRAERVRRGRQCVVPEVPRAVARDWSPPADAPPELKSRAPAPLDRATAMMVLAKGPGGGDEEEEGGGEAGGAGDGAPPAGGSVSNGGAGPGAAFFWMDEDLSWLLSKGYRAHITRELSAALHADLADAATAPLRGQAKGDKDGGAGAGAGAPPAAPLLPPLRVRYGGTTGDFAAAAGALGVSARAVHAGGFPPGPDGKPAGAGYEFCYSAGGPPPEFSEPADACLPFLPAGGYAGVVAARSSQGRRVWLVPHAYDAVLPVTPTAWRGGGVEAVDLGRGGGGQRRGEEDEEGTGERRGGKA